MNYILDGHNPVKNRHVGYTYFGKIVVSTVFLGINHSFIESQTPILFETMIFGCSEFENYQERCCTWEEAEKMHEIAVNLVKSFLEYKKNESL